MTIWTLILISSFGDMKVHQQYNSEKACFTAGEKSGKSFICEQTQLETERG